MHGDPTDYRFFRYAYASCLLDDGYFCFTAKDKEYSNVTWFDEFDFKLGAAVTQPPAGPWQSGVWRRDFERGIALVNPTKEAVTVTLDPGFCRLKGKQDPATNDGSPATSRLLPARDGIILYRQSGQRSSGGGPLSDKEYLSAVLSQELTRYAGIEVPSRENIHVLADGPDMYLEFRLVPGQPKKNKGIRAEISVNYPYSVGEVVRYRWEMRLPGDFKADEPRNRWWVMGQWHDQPDPDQRRDLAGISGTQPARVLQLWAARRRGLSLVTGRLAKNEERWSHSPYARNLAQTGRCDQMVSRDDGQVAVFFDGSKAPAVTGTGPNMHNGFQHYLKLGMYRHPEDLHRKPTGHPQRSHREAQGLACGRVPLNRKRTHREFLAKMIRFERRMKRRLVLKHVGAATLGLVPVLAIAVASCWLVGCGGFARPTPAAAPVAESAKVTDLRPLWDAERVLHNPYKGWYHHYYDNGTRNYRLGSDDDLDRFPGMDHLYIASPGLFQPQEGHYNWSWIDEVKDHWTAKGYGISLRISTCETGEAHATPEWVIAGWGKAAMYKAYGREVWVPEYDDPIFLSKLYRFVGELGEALRWSAMVKVCGHRPGHLGRGAQSSHVRQGHSDGRGKKHVDIYSARFRRSVLVLSDDAVDVHGRKPDEEKELRDMPLLGESPGAMIPSSPGQVCTIGRTGSMSPGGIVRERLAQVSVPCWKPRIITKRFGTG